MKKREKGAQYIASPINNQMLNYGEYYMSVSEKLLFSLAAFILGGIVGWVFYGGLFKEEGEATTATYVSNMMVFVTVGCIAMRVFLPAIEKLLKKNRAKKLQKQFMDMLEGIAASLTAGNTVNDSFINAKNDLLNQYSEEDMIVLELREIEAGLNNGKTLEEMLSAFGGRSGNEDIENFSNVISNCYRLGGDFKDVVRKTRDIISDKIAVSEEIETKLASNKLQHNAMTLMPIFLVAMLKVSSPDFADNLSTPVGVFAITAAIGIFIGAFFWGRKIIEIG